MMLQSRNLGRLSIPATIACVLLTVVLALLAPAVDAAADPKRFLVSFEQGSRKFQVKQDLESKGYTVVEEFNTFFAVERADTPNNISQTPRPGQLVNSIPEVLTVVPDPIRTKNACLGFSDTIVPYTGTGGGVDILPYGIPTTQANDPAFLQAAAQVKDNIIYCVVDDGVDTSQPDFAVDVATLPCTGCDFNAYNPSPGASHGTHVAGTVLALENGKGVIGVARYGSTLAAKNVFGPNAFTGASVYLAAIGKCIDQLETIQQSTNPNMRLVVNLSLGGPTYDSLEEKQLAAHYNRGDILMIASAGNGGSTAYNYPASYPSLISIASTDKANVRTDFSQYNDQVELAAPGSNVLSSVTYTPLFGELTTTPALDPDPSVVGFTSPMIGSGTGTVTAELYSFGLGTSIDNGASGKICLIQRGGAYFCNMVLNCMDSGGIAAIIYNLEECGGIDGRLNGNPSDPTDCDAAPYLGNMIPTTDMTKTHGQALLSLMTTSGPVTATLKVSDNEVGIDSFSGTSMSAPHVTGIAGVVWSKYPCCPNSEVRRALQESALDLGTAGKDNVYGYGLIQAKAALDKLGTYACAQINTVGCPVSQSSPRPPPPRPPPPSPPPPRPPPPSPPPPPPRSSPPPSKDLSPRSMFPGDNGCGKSPLKGKRAAQSTVWNNHKAAYAVNGDCRTNPKTIKKTCAATSPTKSNPWWTAALGTKARVKYVAITIRSDEKHGEIGGALVYVGSSPWKGASSRSLFKRCGKVPGRGLKPGQRVIVKCRGTGVVGSRVAVYLPKKKKSLVLCEVDASLQRA